LAASPPEITAGVLEAHTLPILVEMAPGQIRERNYRINAENTHMLNNSNLISFAATSDAPTARQFYQEILGLTFVSGDQFALVFEANRTMLRIQLVDQVNPHGYTALGWNVSDIRTEVRTLSRRGVRFSRYEGMNQDEHGIWTSPSGAKIAWFSDPDGNILSLTEF
jgi:catechol 2,3-dioxygenase-like lactoylglutathione lyase family enzyme